MYFIINGKLVLCDCNFINQDAIFNLLFRFLQFNLTMEKLIVPASSLDDNDCILGKMHIIHSSFHTEQGDFNDITKITSCVPFTTAFLGFYMKNNWLYFFNHHYLKLSVEHEALWSQFLLGQVDWMNKQIERLPQLCGVKLNDYLKNDEREEIFNHMLKKPQLFEKFIQTYYPDLYALKQVLPYTEFYPIQEWDVNQDEINSREIRRGELNSNMLKQLKLKPNIRK